MAEVDADSVQWLRHLVAGDDDVMAEFVSRYLPSLQRLANANMIPALKRRVGEDDIANSVCRTFLRRATEGEFRLQSTDELWRLLCAITLTKVRQHARFHYREKRSINREAPLKDDSGNPQAMLRDDAASADEAVSFAECMQQLFDSLDPEEKLFVELRLEGLTQLQIAERLSRSERTVRRLLTKVRERWRQLLGDSLPE